MRASELNWEPMYMGDSTLDFREAVTRNNDDEGKDDSAEKRPKIF